MKLRQVPPNVLNAVAALLAPFAPEASPTAIVEALQAHGAEPAPAPGTRRMLSLRESGRSLGVSEWTVRRLVLAGKLPGRRVGGQWRIPVAAVDAMASGATPEAAAV